MSSNQTDTFLYFGYGSNLLTKRIHLQNPSAVFVSIGRLDGYKLSFDNPSSSWRGASATVSPSDGEHVWGAVWRMNTEDLPHLDDQEGVSTGVYKPLTVQVVSPTQDTLTCRTYQLLKTGHEDTRPSPHYLDVIIRGAVEIGLPHEYVERLRGVEHNNYEGRVELYERLNLSPENAEVKIPTTCAK